MCHPYADGRDGVAEVGGCDITDRDGGGIRRILANVRSERKYVIRLLCLEERATRQSHLGHDLVRDGDIRGLYGLRGRHAQEH